MARLKSKPDSATSRLNEQRKRKRDAEQDQPEPRTTRQKTSGASYAQPEWPKSQPPKITTKNTRARAAEQVAQHFRSQPTQAKRGRRGAASAAGTSVDKPEETIQKPPSARKGRGKQAAQQTAKKIEPTRRSTRGKKRAHPKGDVESSTENVENRVSRHDNAFGVHEERLDELEDGVTPQSEARTPVASEEIEPSEGVNAEENDERHSASEVTGASIENGVVQSNKDKVGHQKEPSASEHEHSAENREQDGMNERSEAGSESAQRASKGAENEVEDRSDPGQAQDKTGALSEIEQAEIEDEERSERSEPEEEESENEEHPERSVPEQMDNGNEERSEPEEAQNEPEEHYERSNSPESEEAANNAAVENNQHDSPAEESREGSESVEQDENESDISRDETGMPKRKKETRDRRRGDVTPEGAEDVEIDPDEAMMFDLTGEMKQGKTSQLEAQFREINWDEVKRREREEQERALEALVEGREPTENRDTEERENSQQSQSRSQSQSQTVETPPPHTSGPQLKLVNGEMVIDESTLVQEERGPPRASEQGSIVEESDLTQRVNSKSWVTLKKRDPIERIRLSGRAKPWNELETEQFYEALSQWGTDFMIISRMFPGRTRAHVKAKFTREEKQNPERVEAALVEPVPMDIATYAEATGKDPGFYKDPDEFNKELEVAEQEHREEIEKFRREAEEEIQRKQDVARAKAEARQAKKNETKATREAKKNKSGEGQKSIASRRVTSVDGETVVEEWSEDEQDNGDGVVDEQNSGEDEASPENGEESGERNGGEGEADGGSGEENAEQDGDGAQEADGSNPVSEEE
ncbi:MAG: Transcription factor TFIIIB component B [Alyxoria varia]|nr:MAG: Transcription factor TFIIIB component B [Alyxoria varia]